MAIWRMAFRDSPRGPSFWLQCSKLGVAAITYEPVVDVDFSVYEKVSAAPGWRELKAPQKGCLRHFVHDVQPGDLIYVKEGPMIVGKGVVSGPYEFDAAGPILVEGGASPYRHQRRVEWFPDFEPVKIQVGRPAILTLLQLRPQDVLAIEARRRRVAVK